MSKDVIIDFKNNIDELHLMIKNDHLNENCESCVFDKHHRRSFQEMNKRYDEFLRLIHSNLCD